jgi:hypothetical protein
VWSCPRSPSRFVLSRVADTVHAPSWRGRALTLRAHARSSCSSSSDSAASGHAKCWARDCSLGQEARVSPGAPVRRPVLAPAVPPRRRPHASVRSSRYIRRSEGA